MKTDLSRHGPLVPLLRADRHLLQHRTLSLAIGQLLSPALGREAHGVREPAPGEEVHIAWHEKKVTICFYRYTAIAP